MRDPWAHVPARVRVVVERVNARMRENVEAGCFPDFGADPDATLRELGLPARREAVRGPAYIPVRLAGAR